MELYLGGADNGKLNYVLGKFGNIEPTVAEGATADWETLCRADIIHSLHLWIRRQLEAGQTGEDLKARVAELLNANPNVAVIMDEIGCGIVPMDALDREYRELTGRISCYLAEQAELVVRIQCGMGQVIKQEASL